MNVGGGEAADQVVRMMLSGGEVAVRLGGSAMKNLLALTLALAKNHKVLSGKVNLGKMLRQTRDLRQFAMTPEQYRQFKRLAGRQKILFSAVRDKDGRGKLVDVILPVTELDRANRIFARILYVPQHEQPAPQPEQEGRADAPKKDTRSGRDSHDTRPISATPKRDGAEKKTSDRPSVMGKLQGYRVQLQKMDKSAPARAKTRHKAKAK